MKNDTVRGQGSTSFPVQRSGTATERGFVVIAEMPALEQRLRIALHLQELESHAGCRLLR